LLLKRGAAKNAGRGSIEMFAAIGFISKKSRSVQWTEPDRFICFEMESTLDIIEGEVYTPICKVSFPLPQKE
jgi:hypothetical protein